MNKVFFCHTNLRSLSKNKNILEEFLFDLDYQPEAIATCETKFNVNTVSNIDIKTIIFFALTPPLTKEK